jgi:hypothetical protein
MAVDDFLGKKFSERTTGGKLLYGAAMVASPIGIPLAIANEGAKMWNGNKDRLSEIEKLAAELENSEFNTAKETQKMEDYYDQVFLNAAKAQREAEFGFSPEQKAEARQTFAEGSNLAIQNAQNANGGTLQNYINANMNTNANKFATGMASQDAALKMQKQQQVLNYLNQLGSAAGNSQNVFTQNFGKNVMAEQAIGQAEKDWYTQRDANRMALVNAGLSAAGQAAAAGATGGASAAMPTGAGSDIRLKKNIVYSHTENGHKIYEFEYKNEPNVKYSGVMAQEVLETNPSAVIEENGYYKVYYGMLGLTMKKLN